jgi:hypothetical protein
MAPVASAHDPGRGPVAMAMALLFAAVLHGARIAHLRARMCPPPPAFPLPGAAGTKKPWAGWEHQLR